MAGTGRCGWFGQGSAVLVVVRQAWRSMVRSGKFRRVGVSFVMAWQAGFGKVCWGTFVWGTAGVAT